MPGVRVLLLADTHLGFDLPMKPRVERRRRGPDFFANYERALAPAREGKVDLVVHGGDLLFRSRVRRELVYRAFEPLIEVAAAQVPVVVVPGNHERSAIPFPLLAAHERLHILDRPRTVRFSIRDQAVAVAGFPFQRDDVRGRFPRLVRQTGCLDQPASIRLLCIHQTVEGARVGPSGYTFRSGADVIRGRDIPAAVAAVVAGHIHRPQTLTEDLAGRPLGAPVLYPGSIERTSAAERNEPKGFMTLRLQPNDAGGTLVHRRFHELPTRPMIDLDLPVEGLRREELIGRLRELLAPVDPDAVVRLRALGRPEPDAARLLGAESLRSIAPKSMTLTLRRPRRPGGRDRAFE